MSIKIHKIERLIFLGIFLCLSLVRRTYSDFISNSAIRTGSNSVIPAGSFFSSSMIPPAYNVPFTSIMAGITSTSIGIVGFQAPSTNDFSPNVTILTFTTSGITITVRVYGDTILTLLKVNYLAIGPSINFIQAQNTCFLCTVLSVGNGSRTQARTGITNFIATNLRSQVYLSSFLLHNSLGTNNYLAVSSSISQGSRTVNLFFTTSENNTIDSICFTTIVYYHDITQIDFFDHVHMEQNTLSNSTTPSVIYVSPNNKFTGNNYVFFGLSAFNVSRTLTRLFEVITTNVNNLAAGYRSNFATYAVVFSHLYIAKRSCWPTNQYYNVPTDSCVSLGFCSSGTYPTNAGRFCNVCHYTCKTCNAPLQNDCTISCETTHFRTFNSTTRTCPCNPGYTEIGNSVAQCYPCSTFIPGCNVCYSTFLCDTCLGGYTPNANGSCSCINGFLVSGLCINIVGCISAVQYSGDTRCVSCNQTLNFYRTDSFTCQCLIGYTLVNYACVSKCGDAITATGEQCDDGNNENGDGCSRLCTIELGWNCVNILNPSFCTIIINPILALRYVYRNPYANQMEVAIDISPKYEQFTLAKFKSLISHSIPVTDFNATYSQGLLILNFAYSESIEGNTYNLSLALDPDFFTSSTASLQIPAIGMNTKLTYDNYYTNNFILEIAVYVLDALALIVFILSVISERMIGLQMIQTLQITLFLMPIMGSVPSSLGPLQKLKYTNGYNFYSNEDKARQFTYTFGVSAIGIEKQFLLSFNLMYIILAVVLVICLFLKIVQIVARKRNEEQTNTKEDMVESYQSLKLKTRIFNFAFERVLFIASFISMYIVFFAMAVQLSDLQSLYLITNLQFNLFSTALATLIMFALITLVIINAVYSGTNLYRFSFQFRKYTIFYFLYRLVMILSLSFVYTQFWLVYVFIGTTGLSLLVCIILRPYPQIIHNAAIIFHEIVILFVLSTYLFEIITDSGTEQYQIFFQVAAYLIVFLLYLVVIWNAIRLFKSYSIVNNSGMQKSAECEDAYQDNPLIKITKMDGKSFISPTNRRQLEKPLEIQLLNTSKNNDDKDPFYSKYKKGQKDSNNLEWTYNQMNQIVQPKNRNLLRINIQDTSLIKGNNSQIGSQSSADIKLVIQKVESIKENQVHEQSPYDEFGFINDQCYANCQVQPDPLKIIKRKLRKEYIQKIRERQLPHLQQEQEL